jgi:tRNA modification GTPase
MTLDLDDVIAAVATPAGPAERSVIRLSGAGVVEVLRPRFAGSDRSTDAHVRASSAACQVARSVITREGEAPAEPRARGSAESHERLGGSLALPTGGTPTSSVDEALGGHASWTSSQQARRHPGHYQIDGWRVPVPVDLWLWPTSRSYTGQPSAELHLIGAPPIVDAVLEQLYCDGARPARAGEFTLRAFLAGRVDLVQAEAVLGVIDAADHEQLQTALTQLAGGLSRQIAEVRESLLLDLADMEAGLDFVDEDIEFVQREQMLTRIAAALELTERLLQQNADRMVSGTRPRVVLAGLPNAGKSTLFNRLIGEQRAIVSSQAGTTRDYLSAELNWNGLALELIDTAGADTDSIGIAAQAEQLRQWQVEQADLVVWCSSLQATEAESRLDKGLWESALSRGTELMRVWTQCDAGSESVAFCSANERPFSEKKATNSSAVAVPNLYISALTGEGITDLEAAIVHRFNLQATHRGEWLATTAARSRDSLGRCVENLRGATVAAEQHLGDELISIELRAALDALGEVCGAVHTDDILDRIFSRFCIGK